MKKRAGGMTNGRRVAVNGTDDAMERTMMTVTMMMNGCDESADDVDWEHQSLRVTGHLPSAYLLPLPGKLQSRANAPAKLGAKFLNRW